MAQLQIKPVNKAAKGHNRFCGPAALSIISGIDTAQAAYLLRSLGKRKSITGTSTGEVLRALQHLGYNAFSVAKVNPLKPKDNPTLAGWLRATTKTRGSKLYLIDAGHHWQVVQGRRYACGLTGSVVSIKDDKVRRRARVCGVWQIEHLRFKPSADDLARMLTPPAPKRSAAAAKARRLAQKHDIEIETEVFERGTPDAYTRIMVWGPNNWAMDNHEDHDPYAGDHYADDWEDALERVQQYVLLQGERPDLFK